MATKIFLLLTVAAYVGLACAFDKASIIPSVIPDPKIRLKFSEIECYDMVRLATAGDRLDMVKLLVDQGCSVNRPRGSKSKEPTSLHIAVINDSVPMVKLLLAYDADINARANMAKEIDHKKMAMCKYMLQS